ncbi:hepatocyte nuclear factor 6-like isoform X2 [Ictalurus furcatus]|uniref:hepatocyte nuclear factor 6-like isoform X2 n=1 Tax=Ictalurus furcatus TaxID=66913 RepID=UPI002350FA16|nr:hepatocyte nuclear factor 6-like isoform X2 [Ictalurus furcatus]
MNAQLSMESLGDLHGASHEAAAAVGHARSVAGMASILESGDYPHPAHPHHPHPHHPHAHPHPHQHRPPEHAGLAGHLHAAMSGAMACEATAGMGMSGTYTTLTPLQPLPPISTVSDKFPHHPHPHAHPHQRIAGNVSGSFTLMRDERALASVNNLYAPYHKDVASMGAIHGSQHALPPPPPPPPYAHEKMLAPAGFDSHHPAMHASSVTSSTSSSSSSSSSSPATGMMVQINGIHHHHHHHQHHHHPHHPHAHLSAQGHHHHHHHHAQGALGAARDREHAAPVEEVNTKEVAQRITTELKRYSIPQAIFAQRVLCRSQGTLSDLLRNPKPWSKLKSGRETFRRMWKWLQEPEFQRMSALRLAGQSLIVQKEGAGTREKRARKRLEETATGFHRCPASDFTCNIQREQASVQRVTNHHLSAAGPGARHRQQLLHERSPAESR